MWRHFRSVARATAMHHGETAVAVRNSQGTGNKIGAPASLPWWNSQCRAFDPNPGMSGPSGCPHGGNALNEGFLGTAAPPYADVVVVSVRPQRLCFQEFL